MPHRAFVEIMDLIVLLLLFGGAPATAVLMGVAAWKGIPRNFSREAYWTAFAFAMTGGVLLIMAFLQTDPTGLWRTVLHFVCGVAGALAFGIGMGCGLSVFTYRGPTFSPLSQPKK